MIRFRNLSKSYVVRGVETWVARRITIDIPDRRSVALLGKNGAGKSSLLRMIAGTMDPSAGRIDLDGQVSWPVGFAGSFHGDLTGAENVRFVARIYGVEAAELVQYVREFSELGAHLNLPVRTYSAGMRSRLAFGLSLGIHFDTYLVDEVTSVGAARFKAKSEALLTHRLKSSGAIIVSHALPLLERICEAGMVLHGGTLTWHDDVKDAIAHHRDFITA